MKQSLQRWGWKPDRPDHRDKYFIPKLSRAKIPDTVENLMAEGPCVVDQGQCGSCSGNAVAAIHEFEQIKQGRPIYVPDGKTGHDPSKYAFAPSRLMIYYVARDMEGSADQDAGCEIRDAISGIATVGVCSSKSWPYHVQNFALRPTSACYAEAKQRGLALQYHRIDGTLNDMLSCLAQGMPFVFGISVYESFESDEVAQTGIVPMPGRNEEMLGGHALCAVGFHKATKQFIVRNSWGAWGMDQGGYCLIPFDYLSNSDLCDDRWAVTSVE